MTLAAIMVYVDFDDGAEGRIGVAAGIADQFNSPLIGVAGWALRKHDGLPLEVEFAPDENARREAIAKQLERLEDRFRRYAKAVPRGVEWRSSTGFPREVIATQARAADIVVIGQDALPGDIYRTYDPGTIILAAGRPVLLVPRGVHRLEASRVLIAWKDTREAHRAVHDALPFLKRAQEISIAAAYPDGSDGSDARMQIADVAQYLARHGVAISRQIVTAADGEEARALLDLAKRHEAGLIVAGAYGRTRLSEWIFGGVTRQLLLKSPIPCLFSN